MLSAVRFAQKDSQRTRNNATIDQARAALKAATFSLITTKSPVDSGRVERNGGKARWPAQKSGLENPLPIGPAKSTGAASVQPRIHNVSAVSSRRHHEMGATTTTTITAVATGRTRPACRHSYQN